MAFYEDILNGLTRVPQEQVPAFGALSVPMKAGGPQPQMQPAMAQPAPLMPETGGFDDLATFLAGMGEGGGALLPALGSGMRAVSGEKERRGRINETYNFLVKKGMDPDTAKAVMGNPELLKLELRKFYQDPREAEMQRIEMDMARAKLEAMKQGPEAPAGYRRNPDGSMTFIPGGPQDPATLEAQAKARSAASGNTLESKVAEREAIADRLGLQGEIRKHYVATGTMPRTAPPQEMREYQTKDAMWAERMLRSEKNIDKVAGIDETGKPLQGAYNPARDANKFWPDDMWGANLANSAEWQQYQQAARESIAAMLRKDTGAAVTQQEWDLYFPMLFPQPGDDAAAVKQKKESRMATARALRASSGAAFDKMFPGYDAGGVVAPNASGVKSDKPDPLGIR